MTTDNVATGDNSINISGSDIHIHGGIHQRVDARLVHDEFGRILVDARRTAISKIPITASRSLLIGGTGMLVAGLSNISSIFSASPSSIPPTLMHALNISAMPVLLISGMLLIVGIYLKLHSASFVVSIFGNVGRGRDDILYFSRVRSACTCAREP